MSCATTLTVNCVSLGSKIRTQIGMYRMHLTIANGRHLPLKVARYGVYRQEGTAPWRYRPISPLRSRTYYGSLPTN